MIFFGYRIDFLLKYPTEMIFKESSSQLNGNHLPVEAAIYELLIPSRFDMLSIFLCLQNAVFGWQLRRFNILGYIDKTQEIPKQKTHVMRIDD